jgi:SAM-dependent methyltransferase
MKAGSTQIENHYQADYFNNYQKAFGEFGGHANKFFFEKKVSSDDVVLDFGCGGGFLLNNLPGSRKIGIEINPVARAYCNEIQRIACYESLSFVPDASVDVAISSHCLEHTENPLGIVSALFQKLKEGGKIIVVVPLDNYRYRWRPNDVNNHLYSFSPMNLGNILQAAGFTDISARSVFHKWIPGYKTIYRLFGSEIFHVLCRVYGAVNRRYVQIIGLGIKPERRFT